MVDICENFNDHFSSVADHIIKNHKSNASTEKLDIWVNSKLSTNDIFSYKCILPEEVLTELLKLDVHKSSGLDGISPSILKISAYVIYESLTHIYNLSLCTGTFPSKLKMARVTPLFKAGDSSNMNNYRPISVLPVLSKLFEKMVYSQIYEYLTKFNLIHANQSGFRSKHSCVTALTKIVDELLKEIDQGYYSGVLFLDFKKAFDMVNHAILVSKLQSYKLDNLALKWFDSYLSERSQKVVLNNYESNAQAVHYGIPQGSILGPLLFLLYINDLPLYLDNSTSDLYADDTTIHCSSSSVSNINMKLNNDMKKIHDWCNDNDMVINTEKSKSMIVGSCHKLQNADSDLKILYEDILLENVENEKLLGIYIDNSLSWSEQINHMVSKISSRLGLLSRLRTYLPMEGLIMYYNGYILPLFDYCCTIWGETTYSNVERLFKLQKRAARIILNAKYDVSSSSLFHKLGWLTIQKRIEYHKGVLMFKCVNKTAPDYLCNLFISCTNATRYSLRSAEHGNLFVPRPNSNFMKRTFHYSGTILWNSLPTSLKSMQNIDTFKIKYMQYLMNQQENVI